MSRTEALVYHQNCHDGALAAALYLDTVPKATKVILIPWGWGKGCPPELSGEAAAEYDKVTFVDCAPDAENFYRLRPMTYVMIFDHHDTTLTDLVGKVGLLPAGEICMERAACQIVWDHFNPGVPRPWYVDVIGDRDRWVFDRPNIRALVRGYPYPPWTFPNLRHLNSLNPDTVAADGARYLETDAKVIARLASESHPVHFMTEAGPVLVEVWEAPLDYDQSYYGRYISDVGNVLAAKPGVGFSLQVWRDGGLSFRSDRENPSHLKVNVVAQLFGGGGHPHAAGAKTGKTFTFPGSVLIAYPELFRTVS